MKLSKKELKRKAKETKDLIKGFVDETIDIPDNAIIIDPDILVEIFTKKRLELIRFINQYSPKSMQELANLTKRKKQAVDRDLKILERHELIKIQKSGKNIIPKVEKKFLVLGLIEPLNDNLVKGHEKLLNAIGNL
jgi:DNA-binding transcriptional ArsR family regulator